MYQFELICYKLNYENSKFAFHWNYWISECHRTWYVEKLNAVGGSTLIGFSNEFISGAMYYPSPWHATSDCTPEMSPKACKFDLRVPSNCTGRCSRTASKNAWFTNYTAIPGEATLPEDMYDQCAHRKPSSEAGLHPWNAPGTAPTFGNGCGVNGGNPNGCNGEGRIKHH